MIMMPKNNPQPKKCNYCGYSESDITFKEYAEAYNELFDITPKEVWRKYHENGYTINQALREEWACA